MRVLFFIAEYHRFSGAQISLLHLVNHLRAAGIESIVLFPGDGVCAEKYRESRVPVEILPAPSPLHQFGESALGKSLGNQVVTFGPAVMRYSLSIANLMRRRKIDVLHCNTLRAVLLGAFWPRLWGYPVVWHVRGLLPMNHRLINLGVRLSSSINLVADALKDEFADAAQRKCVTIHDAVHVEKVDQLASQQNGDGDLQNIADDQSVIATMSAIAPFKGLHHLIEAARLFNSSLDSSKPLFLILGGIYDEEYHQHLRQLINRYHLDNVRLLGWKENPFPYYRRAQMVVLPTVRSDQLEIGGVTRSILGREGLPFSILEAMAVGKPVVATDVAGISEQIVEGATGFVVPQCNPQAIADAISILLANPKLAEEMGHRGRARIEEYFNCDLMVGKTQRLYEMLVG